MLVLVLLLLFVGEAEEEEKEEVKYLGLLLEKLRLALEVYLNSHYYATNRILMFE